jgi:anti-sigma regulatory factor (Ser/Thr protein kinase)
MPDEFEVYLPKTDESVRAARMHVASFLASTEADRVAQAAKLVASELVTNAICHGSDPIGLRLVRHTDALRIEVFDGTSNTAEVKPRQAHPTDAHGRGLQIVGAVAARWGVTHHDHGKVIWAVLDVPSSSNLQNATHDRRTDPGAREHGP